MAEKSYQLEIISPKKVVYNGEVDSFTAPGVMGSFQVLYNHAPLLAEIGVGEVKLHESSGNEFRFATSGGFVEVNNNRVVVLAESVERPDEIDVKRAESAKQRARQRLQQRAADLDVERAQAALARALNRLKMAQRG